MELDIQIFLPAFLAGLLVVATHVPLGREVLRRGIIFIDLAVAQIAVLGVVVAQTMQWGEGGIGTQLAAFGGAIAGSLILHTCERRWPQIQEAIIGSSFVVASAVSVLLLAHNPHGGEQLQQLLSGQILWVSWNQLGYIAVLYGLVLATWWRLSTYRGIAFYLLFAVTVTASVQLVGVLLVFASLVIPALIARNYQGRRALLWAYAHALLAYIAGFIISSLADLPAGPSIVLTLALLALLFARLPVAK
ncbi:MAG: zinc/manganese transporter permease [Acidithiobacillales bacterium SG8_45]|jgi:zinc/manganese transport system permease protein|nr:MAG: zinc/manganese transporter permease [Acidithiobacillales bacterium SG8_45]